MTNYGRDELEKAAKTLSGVVAAILAGGILLIVNSLKDKDNDSSAKDSNDDCKKSSKNQRQGR